MQAPWQEKILLYRLHQKDPDAFAALYDLYAPAIYRYIFFKVRTSTEAEDLTAEVFLKTWEYVQRKDSRIGNFRAFIYRLARNTVVDHYRQKAERELLQDDEVLQQVPMPEENGIVAELARASDMATIERALRKLKDEYREVLILRYIEGYAIGDVAKIQEKSSGAVRVTMHRALKALKDELDSLIDSSTNRLPATN